MTVKKQYCPNCGNEVQANDKFCEHCGAQLTAVSQPSATPQPAPTASATKTKHPLNRKTVLSGAAAGIVIVAILIFLAIPKGLRGNYVYRDWDQNDHITLQLTFKGDTYTYRGQDKSLAEPQSSRSSVEKGHFKVNDRTVTLTSDQGKTSTAVLTKDKQRILYETVYFAKKK